MEVLQPTLGHTSSITSRDSTEIFSRKLGPRELGSIVNKLIFLFLCQSSAFYFLSSARPYRSIDISLSSSWALSSSFTSVLVTLQPLLLLSGPHLDKRPPSDASTVLAFSRLGGSVEHKSSRFQFRGKPSDPFRLI